MMPPPAGSRRLFLALWPDAALRQSLAVLAATVAPLADARPVPPANLHLTLAFLGQSDLPDKRFAPLSRISAAPFELTLETLGCWIGPHVLWLGPRECPPALSGLSAEVRAWLTHEQIQFDHKEFNPHVTLARKAAVLPEVEKRPLLHWSVSSFVLVESVSQPGGPVYRVVQEYPLSGNRSGSRHDPNQQ